MPSVREQTEQIEMRVLSRHAAKARESRGRETSEPPDPIRTCFQRDRDRIIHSKPFRRLKHKTQVFIDPDGDHFRTRLTHTLEVAQIARTVTRALRLNEDLTEAIALGHDLGHTPFGHAGEQALDEAMRELDPESGFKHYEQSLRVVRGLAGGESLNLTYETLEGIGGHSKGRSDLEEETHGATMESGVVRVSDRIAYLNHDLDDAFRAGLIGEEDVPEEVLEGLGDTHGARIAAMVTDLIQSTGTEPRVRLSDRTLELMNLMKEFMFERVYENNPDTMRDVERAKEMLRLLFRYYLEHPEMLPEAHLPAVVKDLPQAVCDYVAGMTDRFAARQFETLFLPNVWRRF